MIRLFVYVFVFTLIGYGGSVYGNVVIPDIQAGEPFPSDLFIKIAQKINPSVVSISTLSKNPRSRSLNNDPFFDFFFNPQPQSQPQRSGLGSGFIIEPDGHIVTNAHVIIHADSILVHVKDDPTVYEANVIGKDEKTDIALIKIEARQSRTRKSFSTVSIGDSNALQVGETVVAFGNPFGHSNTMTKGIISALDRRINELNLFPFLQTDASINPGNSGGPLVNVKGEVVGVNTAINPNAVNIGFAIPIYNVNSILKALKKDGYVKRGFIGIQMRPDTVGFDYKEKSYKGVLVTDVVRGGPADQSGIRPRDIITEFNKTPIQTSKDLHNIVSGSPVGETVSGRLFRDNKIRSFKVTIREWPNQKARPVQFKQETKLSSKTAPYGLGFSLSQSDSKLPSHLNLPLTYVNKPIVIEVKENSSAGRSGLKEGDIIFSINNFNVQTVKQAFSRLRNQRENVIHVLRYDQPGRYKLKQIKVIKN